ncbi:glycosyltransferase [Acetobacter fallax]|uniref:Glycosyltransferase n=1 Tax=Acetobacter fallax TaxID=1737473 RepID=A0ABX0KC87_9PROT|nr:glycosyltransferase [Acetobacter fallax]NHO32778.1 glycosyltransferase [Acetobacter fallax]NHO36341.1 glycosyltransferase [Acetobacter fallax]
MKAVSIAMATFNGTRYIGEQLESLRQQTFLPAELVVCDDRSSDDTIAKIEVFAKTAPFPVRIYVNEVRLGFRGNFMKAAHLCCSDLIAFCDQDDHWYPEKLSRCVEVFQDESILLVHHEARIVQAGKILSDRLDLLLDKNPVVEQLRSRPWLNPCGFTMVFQASLKKYESFWQSSIDLYHLNEKDTHDGWYFFLATSLGRTAFIEQSLADYRQHGSNAYGWNNRRARTMSERLTCLISNRSERLRAPAITARCRRDIFRRALSEPGQSGPDTIALQRAERCWSQLEKFCSLRLRVYENQTILLRLEACLKLLRLGAYSATASWDYGKKAGLRDLALGVVLSSFTRRYGTRLSGVDQEGNSGTGAIPA